MAHAYFHGRSSQRRWGGNVDDYLNIHSFFDSTKAYLPDARHRLVLHNYVGISLAEHIFHQPQAKTIYGAIINADGKEVTILDIGQQHVIEDFGHIPAVADVVLLLSKSLPPRLANFNMQRVDEFLHEKLGGTVEDYEAFKNFFSFYSDIGENKAGYALLCNAFGLFMCEKYLGVTWVRPSDSRLMPTRYVAEKLVKLGYGNLIPTLQDILRDIKVEKWMFENAAALDAQFQDAAPDHSSFENPIVTETFKQLQLPL